MALPKGLRTGEYAVRVLIHSALRLEEFFGRATNISASGAVILDFQILLLPVQSGPERLKVADDIFALRYRRIAGAVLLIGPCTVKSVSVRAVCERGRWF